MRTKRDRSPAEKEKENDRETVVHGNAVEEALNIRWVLADITIMQLWT